MMVQGHRVRDPGTSRYIVKHFLVLLLCFYETIFYYWRPGRVAKSVILGLRRHKEDHCKSKASLGYKALK